MINPHVAILSKSATLKITALTKKLIAEGKDIVNFAAGEPDFDTPEFIKIEAKAAIDAGFTKYTPSCGLPQLRQAIADKLLKENNLSLKPEEIIVTSGAKYAIYAALITLLADGDEVIIPSPYWVSYPEMARLAGAKIKFLPCRQDEDFKINPQSLKQLLTPKTKVLILNYPNNPTGVTYLQAELEEIYKVIAGKDIFVISDEIYEILTYDSRKHCSFASLFDAAKQTITVNGFSKTFSMTGWRLGYLGGPLKLIEEISKLIDHTTSCACSISQKAAQAAIADKQWPRQVQKIFQERRDIIWSGLKQIKGLTPLKPQGAFYLFCDIRDSGLGSFDFVTQLLEKYAVSCIPADSFGQEGFIRISFATSIERIKEGVERIKKFLLQI